jgi:hypothetical protein
MNDLAGPSRAPAIKMAIARALELERPLIARRMLEGLSGWPKFADQLRDAADHQDFTRRELHAYVDYLALYFRTGDNAYKHLYVGEKLKQLYWPDDSPDDARERKQSSQTWDRVAVFDAVRARLDAKDLSLLADELESISSMITTAGSHQVEVLFVGDCIFLDVLHNKQEPG